MESFNLLVEQGKWLSVQLDRIVHNLVGSLRGRGLYQEIREYFQLEESSLCLDINLLIWQTIWSLIS